MSRVQRLKDEKYAEILLPQKVGFDKETLTYAVPADLDVNLGDLVEVPLRNRSAKGLIFAMHNQKPAFKTRNLVKKLENIPPLKPWQIDLLKHIAGYYFCPLFKCLKLFLPTTIFTNKKFIQPVGEPDEEAHKKALIKHELTPDQTKVISQFNRTQKTVSLLYGITGSGKTEIYMRLAEEQLAQQKQVLILVPEISLTPQTLQRFNNRFFNRTACIHSKLTARQKKEQWLKISSGDAGIIVGSRSALFAPFKDLGLIVIDEEHEPSFKQDQAPRYNTVDLAKKIAGYLKIKLLLGSATPSLESFYQCQTGTYELLELPNRIQFNGGTSLPSTAIIDLRQEIRKGNFSIFSDVMLCKIEQKLKLKQQVILFLNRRGAASAVICRECGFVVKCGHCDVAMTYHKKIMVEEGIYDSERLICHHCGLIKKVPALCPNCGSAYIRYIGLGTQRVEEEIIRAFPLARVIRADSDTVRKNDDFSAIYHAFKNHQADILIGTQMIGKGLHLPKVNLVGVMLADLSLTIPDFRSHERTFQLITQVAGRAGRENMEGEVVLQTYMPENYAVQFAAAHDFKKFYGREIAIREKMGYPPFSRLIKLTVKNGSEIKCRTAAENIYNQLQELLTLKPALKNSAAEISRYPALMSKLRNRYRWHILIKGPSPEILLKEIQLPPDTAIDIDPISVN